MNLRNLKYFLVVAEELHFSRAAERLGMLQPPLSQAIRRLELSLGCTLFTRTRRGTKLTGEGEALLDHAKSILREVDAARAAVLRAQEANVTHFRLGYAAGCMFGIVPNALNELHKSVPAAKISLWQDNSEEQVRKITTGELDFGIFYPLPSQGKGMDIRLIGRSHMVAALPSNCGLSEKATIGLADLMQLPLIMGSSARRPDWYEALNLRFEQAGLTMKIDQVADFIHARLELVSAGFGAALVTSHAAASCYPDVIFRTIRELEGGPTLELVAACSQTAPTAVRRLFDAFHKGCVRGLMPRA